MTDHKSAVVLGASGGIGKAICRRLASDGWSLYLHYNQHGQEAAALSRELSETYPDSRFTAVSADFLSADGAAVLAGKTGHIQAVVAANGQSMMKLLTETDVADMEALWRVHVQNPASFIAKMSPILRSHPVSYVVFIGSIWGVTGAAGEVMYSAVKGAQHAFVKAYAKEAAYNGTRVNAIAPGWVETKMNAGLSEEEKEMVMEEIPLRTVGTPEAVGDAVGFLLSGQADYMTGEIINLNGGWHI